ncbi:F-box/FBD/LRR-repeat protein At5g22660-like [Spinacia oleracea]|uniref:F-box/FBD/LRR-repeat protein At5g22660-like n=1 Tax=Spinacia oleracea TaxID=3562 RepID=A0A9R0JR73_SPIOL|nr:F-box/FBD/LRR-repeat protein At5g22660-like [Spinacia oleracea]
MSERRSMECYVRRRHSSLSEEDRLSSLPDALLIDILSHLQIDCAVATSVLSRRWRHLWTGVTNFKFDCNDCRVTSDKFSSVVVDLLRQLTSPKLRVFKLELNWLANLFNPGVAESCFREVCRRNVDQIIVDPKEINLLDRLPIPACLFNSKSLVILNLRNVLEIDFPENVAIQLPNLKSLTLDHLVYVPHCLESLFRSCPRLEDADLTFLSAGTQIILNIPALNLRSLRLGMCHMSSCEIFENQPPPKIFIDAPKLANLCIFDYTSYYYFIQNPTKLVKASIYLTRDEAYEPAEEDYLHQLSKFVRGMSSVIKLDLIAYGNTNLYPYLNSLNLGTKLIFPNLGRLITELEYIGWNDLLLSMQCFPNLKHLKVNLSMRDGLPMDHMNWCVPDCLVNKLKTIEISKLYETDDDLKLLGYILSNAVVLAKLHVYVTSKKESKEVRLWKVCNFCKSLFKLPRASSTCEIVFCTRGLMRASSNAYTKDGQFTCDIYGLG